MYHRNASTPLVRTAALLVVALFVLTACGRGGTVDRGSGGGYVDTEHRSYVDTGSGSTIDDPTPSQDQEAPVVHAEDEAFVPPPGNYTANATIDLETKMNFVGKDVVKLWLWNERGSQSIIAAEGNTVTIPKMNVEVKIGPIGHENEGELLVYINDKPSRVLNAREETKVGNTWVFVSDIFLNAAQ